MGNINIVEKIVVLWHHDDDNFGQGGNKMGYTFEEILESMSIEQLERYMQRLKEYQDEEIAKELEEKNPDLTKWFFRNMSTSIDYYHNAIERKKREIRKIEEIDRVWADLCQKSFKIDKQMLQYMRFQNPPQPQN